jgi:hypothetical protein
MSESERWIKMVDREGLVALVVEGPFARYGPSVHVTIRREQQGYRVSWAQDGDGAGAAPTGEATHDRAGLERYLEGLLADARPVSRVGG